MSRIHKHRTNLFCYIWNATKVASYIIYLFQRDRLLLMKFHSKKLKNVALFLARL